MQKNLYLKSNNKNSDSELMNRNSINIWIDHLSMFAFPKLLKIIRQNMGGRICYVSSAPFVFKIIRLLRKFFGFEIILERFDISLGNIKIGNLSAGLLFENKIMEIAQNIILKIQESTVYKKIIAYVPKEKIDIFLELRIRNEIQRIVYLILIMESDVLFKKEENKNILLCSNSPLCSILQMYYKDAFFIESYNSLNPILQTIKSFVRNFMNRLFFLTFVPTNYTRFFSRISHIAVHFVEGIDINKRSDVFWIFENGIDPKRMLFYFDLDAEYYSVPSDILERLKKMNISWVCLKRKALPRQSKKNSIRKNPLFRITYKEVLKPQFTIRTSIDKWLAMNFETLLIYVTMWLRFYTSFNIKIVFDLSLPLPESVGQSIALDLVDGIRIGAQRSTIKANRDQYFLRYNTNNLFFVWGEEPKSHQGASQIIKNLIISGYTFDKAIHNHNIEVKNKNTKFVVAMFDNTFSDVSCFSKDMMQMFYREFLNWLFVDKKVTIIVKEKNPVYFDLAKKGIMQKEFLKAEKTGRFIRFKDLDRKRFPSDAAYGVDMTIGIGISSALIETVISGYRGILCDLPGHYFHPYYQWGYGKIIFDDINKLISALKRYKENPANEPELGDWSSYVDKLDPFRDGRAGERVGTYMRWLLESFDAGKNREEAIRYANEQYAKQWGEDKVIDMRNRKENF